MHQFLSIDHARRKIDPWRHLQRTQPHSELGGIGTNEYLGNLKSANGERAEFSVRSV